MSISQLTDYIGNINIAEDLDDQMLAAIGSRVKRQYQEDRESMQEWVDNVEKGIELMRQEWNPKSTPWEGASNYKDPILTEASVKFGDKASLELLRSRELVGCDVIGKDPQQEKKAICERVKEAMNYQINHEMEGWRDDQEKLFYSLPNYGTVFKKVVHDDLEQMNESIVITFPNFAVNQATSSMGDCRSFSHVIDLPKNEVLERVRSGRWLDIDIYPETQGEDKRGDKGSNEANDVEQAEENEDAFIEQQCFFDVDEDGYEEPYIVTIHSKSSQVVRIVARFDEKSITVRYNEKVMPLPEAKEQQRALSQTQFGGQNLMRMIGFGDDVAEPSDDDFELVKIEPFQNVVKYGFIPAPDGTFLDFGYAHLLGALTQGINTTTNQLTDAATLANVGGGFLAKEFRKVPGAQRLRPGEYKKTDVPSDKLQNGVYPNPTPEPSQTLYQLNSDLLERAQQFMAIVDVSGKIQSNTAPTTALAIIQEATIPTTALFSRILKAETREFKILYRINQRTFTKDKYQEILDEEADPQQDFNSKKMDIVPTASADMTSKMQRIQTAQLEMENVSAVLEAGGNPVPIIRNFYEAIGSQLTDKIFPEDGQMSPQERQQMEQMRKAKEVENQIKELQLQILQREQDRLDRENEAEIRKIGAEIEEMRIGMVKTMAEVTKTLEEAESEEAKNQIDIYTQQLDSITNRLKALGDVSNQAEQIRNQSIERAQNVGRDNSTLGSTAGNNTRSLQ